MKIENKSLFTVFPKTTGAQLFNGNISNTTVALNKINTGQASGYSYLYDQLNRLLGMRQHSISGTSWSHNSFNPAYEEKFSYDANGNIKTLLRKGANITGMPLAMDNLKYFYYYTNTSNARAEYDPTIALPGNVKSLSNQLARVTESDPAGNYPDDIDNQTAGNYDYDNIGNLMKDNAEGITGIEWTVYGKIKQIKKAAVTINYSYDVSGNRVSKEVIGAPGGTTKQFYIRDASGNTMAIYNGKTSYVEWAEQHLYGSSRLGIWNYGKQVPLLPVGVGYDSMMVGSFNYELTNHLGNVLSTISDKKVGVSAGGVVVDYYNAEVLGQNDYYSGGMVMPGRAFLSGSGSYRFSINGQEKTPEIAPNTTTAEFWQYDSRIVRRWNVDPLASKFPWQSPYSAFDNNPINKIDPVGMAAYSPIYGTDGKFLGTDDQGLQGKAIVMNKKDFKQNMKHEDAMKKDLAPNGGSEYYKAIPSLTNYYDFYNHYNELDKRPDWDGYLTKSEADSWWLGKSGQPLFVDQSKIELPGVVTKDFYDKKDNSYYKNFVWNLSNTGKVYGTLKLTLLNANTGAVHLGGKIFMDEYDFKMDGRPWRDFATWKGRPGGKKDGVNFFIYGYGQAKVPVEN